MASQKICKALMSSKNIEKLIVVIVSEMTIVVKSIFSK